MAHPSSPSSPDPKRSAKQLRDAIRSGEPTAIARARAIYHDLVDVHDADVPQQMGLLRCQHVIAVEWGHHDWVALQRARTLPTSAVSIPKPPPKFLYVDEFHQFQGENNSAVELIRAMPWVPQESFRVEGRRVFVFAALVKSVQDHLDRNPQADVADEMGMLLPSAWVSAAEAIAQWSVPTRPYRLQSSPKGWHVVHDAFGCVLPGSFATEDDGHRALGDLLLGDVLAGPGSVTFRGQAMTPFTSLLVTDLPPQPPELDFGFAMAPVAGYRRTPPYQPGYDPLTPSVYDAACAAYAQWRRLKTRAADFGKHALTSSPQGSLRWSLIPWHRGALAAGADVDPVRVQVLRGTYPDLHRLADGDLVDLYEGYEMDVLLISPGNDVVDDRRFIAYVVGRLALPEPAAMDHLDGERWIDLGESLLGALAAQTIDIRSYASTWVEYDTAIETLYQRIRAIVEFLPQADHLPSKIGPPYLTMGETMMRMRHQGARVHNISQGPAIGP